MKSFLTIGLLAIASVSAPADEPPSEILPTGLKVVSIEARPASIDLKHKFDYRQLLIIGKLASGETVDLTRIAKPAHSGDSVTVSADGLVRANADGTEKLAYSFDGQSVEIPITVSGVNEPHTVSFVRDVQPALSR